MFSDDVVVRLLRDRYRAFERLEGIEPGEWAGARMLGRPALVVRGREGVRTFYDSSLVTRRGAVPAPVRLLLFGRGAVHGLNGDEHRRRKQLFLDVVNPESVERLSDEVSGRMQAAAQGWLSGGRVRLFHDLVQVYGAAV